MDISNALVKQWELEKIPPKIHLSKEDEACENHFTEMQYKDDHYGVRLPFKAAPFFPGSRQIALSSWSRLARCLAKNSNLTFSYDQFMHEYLQLKHMQPVPKIKIDKSKVYYVPHHAVFHNNKICIVFNASMPASDGLPLYACLHAGSKLQEDIILVLIRWMAVVQICFRNRYCQNV